MAENSWTQLGVYEVAPGVYRIPLPLPNDGLRAVNVYALRDGDDLVLIDSGWALTQAQRALESALGKLGHGFEGVRRFLVTHMHRDHYTLAVALRRIYGTKIAIGLAEQPSLEKVIARASDGRAADLLRWGAQSMRARLWERYNASDENSVASVYELPDEWFDGEMDVELAHRKLRVVPTPGHTMGHVVFIDAESSLLFAGDHVLPHITPSIGFEAARAELPLRDYLDSLRLVRRYPDMRLLPAHGPVTHSVHGRVDELLAHHERRLKLTLEAAESGASTAFEVAQRLRWTRRERHFDSLDVFNQMLAIGETAAHLDLLVVRGLLRSSANDGVLEYRTVSTPTIDS